ncbi:MAG TPA: UDP-glucose 4-epimerase GalE [Magnetospirillum sp.]|nr:UDP-glucose 4-epimerase GalE [Magnetospirillum sp.]
MKPSVLVTGGAGYIGSHACKALAEAGYTPVAYDSLVTGHRWAAQFGPLVVGDLADTALLRRTIHSHGITAAIHFAAFSQVGESMADPRKYFRNNVVNTLGLLDSLVECGVKRLVFSSTAATYGDPQYSPIDEAHPQSPVNPYGESKLLVEKMLYWFGCAYGLDWVALRYFNACGADPLSRIGEDHQPESHLIPLVLQAAMGERSDIAVFGTDYPTPDGTAIRDYIHVDDLSDAHVLALAHLERQGESMALNLGTGSGNSVRQVIDAVERVTGLTVPVRLADRRAGDPAVLVADPAKAREVLGWRSASSVIDSIVASAYAWHSRLSQARQLAFPKVA